MARRLIHLFIFLIYSITSLGQEIVTDGYFIADSMYIGKSVEYSLSIKYPKDREVIFPDSSYNYFPFEFYEKQYFETKVDSVFAYDSVVYSLASFEIDSIQFLQVPIFMLEANDSLEVLPPEDSIYLIEMVSQVPDSLVLRENVAFHDVGLAFNYPYLGIGLGILIFVLVIVYFAFGKSIKRKITLYRLRKEYEKFSLSFERGISKVRKEQNSNLIEEVLLLWKKYMEKLEDRPFTKYTTKEILNSGADQTLKNVLRNIDRSIYGSMNDQEIHKNFESLEDFTLERYKLKVEEVNNG